MTVEKSEDVAVAEEAVKPVPQYYIAVIAINHNGVRVHNVGDKVPGVNVIAHGWQDMVREMD